MQLKIFIIVSCGVIEIENILSIVKTPSINFISTQVETLIILISFEVEDCRVTEYFISIEVEDCTDTEYFISIEVEYCRDTEYFISI